MAYKVKELEKISNACIAACGLLLPPGVSVTLILHDNTESEEVVIQTLREHIRKIKREGLASNPSTFSKES